ncbi:hypothetical protein SEVIR_9G155125v4 [Setaria viridis]
MSRLAAPYTTSSIVAGGVALHHHYRRRACDLTVQGWDRLDPAGQPRRTGGGRRARGTIDRGRGARLTGRPAGAARARRLMLMHANTRKWLSHTHMPSWFSFRLLL